LIDSTPRSGSQPSLVDDDLVVDAGLLGLDGHGETKSMDAPTGAAGFAGAN
jgi:hypothetical protein